MRVASVGEVLWDVFPSGELLGGAPLNFTANLCRLGHQALLLTAVGQDARGRAVVARMQSIGVPTEGVQQCAELATGVALITVNERGEGSFSIPRPAAFDRVQLSGPRLAQLLALAPEWLYYGTLVQTDAVMEQTVSVLAEALPAAGRFYDMNLRTGHWNLALVQRLSRGTTVLKLNLEEAETLHRLTGSGPFSLEAFCRRWASEYGIAVLCVTLGEAGAVAWDASQNGGKLHRAPGFQVQVADTVGSGDAFAAAFLHGYQLGWPMQRTLRFANALGALVASREGATPEWRVEECEEMCGQE
jgi:fructokinase